MKWRVKVYSFGNKVAVQCVKDGFWGSDDSRDTVWLEPDADKVFQTRNTAQEWCDERNRAEAEATRVARKFGGR